MGVLRRLLAALVVCGGAAPVAAPPVVPSESYTHAQQLVAITGGRRLNLFCLGAGSPTVLFEAGSGNNSSTWRRVQAQVATYTRACAYDRAAFGFSDPPGRVVDAANVVDDLQQLIIAAPVKTPVVLVGHAIGGLYATLFAAEHKNEVAGMVLVDPSFAHQFESFAARDGQSDTSALYGKFRAIADGVRACQALVHAAAPGQAPNAREAACLPSASMPEQPDAVLLAALMQEWTRPAPYDAIVSEAESFIPTTEGEGHPPADDGELDAASGNLGDIPLVVLTAGHSMAGFPGLTDVQRAQFAAAWLAGHDALAHRSSRGRHVVVADSGHYIQIEQPAVVLDAIRHVVDEARAAAPVH
jgi:pimeloyl-ACP methyl ester carboxylesterase